MSILKKYIEFVLFNPIPMFTRSIIKQNNKLFKGILLDIGAGNEPYKKFFNNISTYLSTNTFSHYSVKELFNIKKHTHISTGIDFHLPFKNESVDTLINLQVFSVIKDTSHFFKEINRILKPNGILFLTTDFLFPQWCQEDHQRLTLNSISQVLKNSGFEIIIASSYGGILITIYNIIRFTIQNSISFLKNEDIKNKNYVLTHFIILLILSPLLSILGGLFYIIEKNISSMFPVTSNLAVIAKKVDN